MPIEQRGVDTIPEGERTSGPRDLVSILLGSNLCLGVIVFGWLPPSFGLDWWSSVGAVLAGTVVGVLFTAPLALVSLRTGTNLSTSSGAQFGVRGRLVGSVVGLLLALGYTALTVWIGGDVMVTVLGRLAGLPQGGISYGVIYGLLAAATVAGAVHGYRVLLAMSRVLAFGMTALLALGVIAYAPGFTAAALPETGGYLLGGFWPTWLLAAVVATVCVFAGHYYSTAQDAMTSFVLLLTAIGTPWAVITLIGFARCGGVYDADALQVFNRRARGGVYWYRSGWNVPATLSWAAGATVGVLAVSLPSYEGPLLALTGGVDCSFLLSGVVGGVAHALTAPGSPVEEPGAGEATAASRPIDSRPAS
ncbi:MULTISPECIES: cytosine permease [Streptomyces]|uniref:cytosine permease n=1 Tax=Streptomyces TaxID=1883 RepID=UPI000CF20B2C|nr:MULTISPECIES: cytosine permease [Streptomyces]PPS71461.1 cytosine permease [Streptomyces sp. 46]